MAAQTASATAAARHTALERSDDLLQHLAVAKYALTAGDTRRAMEALDAALALSRAALDELVREALPESASSFAGALVRDQPAASPPRSPHR